MGLEKMVHFERNCQNLPGAAGAAAAAAAAAGVAAAAPAGAAAAATAFISTTTQVVAKIAAVAAAAPAVPDTFWQNPDTPGNRYPLGPCDLTRFLTPHSVTKNSLRAAAEVQS